RKRLMIAQVRSLTGLIMSWVPTLLTLALLGGLAWWGAQNDWRIPASAKDPPSDKDESPGAVRVSVESTGTASPGLPSRLIDFPSAEAVSKAGIEWEPVQLRSIAQYVNATAMLD